MLPFRMFRHRYALPPTRSRVATVPLTPSSISRVFCFHTLAHPLAHSFARPKTLSPILSTPSALFAQNTRRGILRRPNRAPTRLSRRGETRRFASTPIPSIAYAHFPFTHGGGGACSLPLPPDLHSSSPSCRPPLRFRPATADGFTRSRAAERWSRDTGHGTRATEHCLAFSLPPPGTYTTIERRQPLRRKGISKSPASE